MATTMDQLPVELLEMIFDKILLSNPEELYRLRAVSHTWKCIVERSSARVFKYWYNRCNTEIPKDQLADIVQAKYPLLAQPWQEFYWVDCRLPDVAKNVYCIWKSFPNVGGNRNYRFNTSNVNVSWAMGDTVNFPGECTVGVNDKYFAVSSYYGQIWGTRVYRWDNLTEHIQEYDTLGDKTDFYTTKNGTYIILAQKTREYFTIFMSKHPIDKQHNLSSQLTPLGRCHECFITQNECFYVTVDDTTQSRIVKHKILTERGFKTNVIVGSPKGMPRLLRSNWQKLRVEICGSTLYVIQISNSKMIINEYEISRNPVNGQLSFTSEKVKIFESGDREFGYSSYTQIRRHLQPYINIEYPFLAGSAFALEKFQSWLSRFLYSDMKLLAAHAKYVFCDASGKIGIFQREDLINSMEVANRNTDLAGVLVVIPSLDLINWIRIIYIKSKAKLLVSYSNTLCLIDFY